MPGVYIDCHTHLYKQFPIAKFFEIAEANFIEQSKQSSPAIFGIFLFSIPKIGLELPSSDDYRALENELLWERQPCDEVGAYCFKTTQNNLFFVLEGIQHASREKLEVLQLGGTLKPQQTALPFQTLLSATISDEEALCSVPWAFGKWAGNRGILVKNALQAHKELQRFFLGDNSGRAPFINKSEILDTFEAFRGFNLTGSDPLPFANEMQRVGKSGIRFNVSDFVPEHPLQSIRTTLLSGKVDSYIQLKPSLSFLMHQMRLHIGI